MATVEPEPGVSLTLASERARTIRDVRYALTFDLPAAISEPVSGRATIRFSLVDPSRPVVLDFAPGVDAVSSVATNGRPSRFLATNGHLIIPAREVHLGENAVEIAFNAGDSALNRNPEFLYTLFVPARAHLTFPCFDQPDLKARYALSLTMPTDWTAVSNGPERSRDVVGDRLTVHYGDTNPISTYLFAFAAGKFSVETAERRGRTFHMLHRETDAAKVSRNRDAIFDLHESALSWLESYTNIPYPFPKFDFVMIPSFQFSGMEHPGAILYNASSMLLDESATESQMLSRASTIAHETAHMWFGDLVTMRWFDDVWMKEVFANFMAAKIVNPSFPGINHDLRFLVAHYPAAYAVDRTQGTHPIRQPLDNLSNAGSQYGAIIYQKAPIVMRQLETLVGADAFRDGLRQYLAAFSLGNATWLDLIDILDARSDRDLTAWSKAWVEEAGRPIIRTVTHTGTGAASHGVSFQQEDAQIGRQLLWTQRMDVIKGTSGAVERIPVELSSRESDVQPTASPDWQFILPTGGGLAYGDVVLDDKTRAFLLARVSELSALDRGAAWVTLWEEMLGKRVSPSALTDALLRALPREDVQQNIQLMVGYLRDSFWRFLPSAGRVTLAPTVERAMRDGMARSRTASAKSTFFNGFRSMVLTPEGVQFLERVWARTEKIPGLPFAEADEATMALELAVRDTPNAASIVRAQRDRFMNPDRKARFEFVMPALASSPETRRTFFESLRDVDHRRREPWVIEGLSYLHHPLRATDATQYVRPALDLLQEVQRTGDIFFPKNWMDATLSGHQSRQVADLVKGFLADRPDYPVRLRRIILQSADDVFRAADIATSD